MNYCDSHPPLIRHREWLREEHQVVQFKTSVTKVKYLYERQDLMKLEIHKGSYIIDGKVFYLVFYLFICYLLGLKVYISCVKDYTVFCFIYNTN